MLMLSGFLPLPILFHLGPQSMGSQWVFLSLVNPVWKCPHRHTQNVSSLLDVSQSNKTTINTNHHTPFCITLQTHFLPHLSVEALTKKHSCFFGLPPQLSNMSPLGFFFDWCTPKHHSTHFTLQLDLGLIKTDQTSTFSDTLFFYSFIHMCIHRLGHFSPHPQPPSLSPTAPRFHEDCSALFSNFVEE
jgi:hypothetical protein